MIDKILYPSHPVRYNFCGPSCYGKSVLLTDLFFKLISEYDKIYINSSSFHQDVYQEIIKHLSNYKLIHKIAKILKEEDIDIVTEEAFINKTFKNQILKEKHLLVKKNKISTRI